MSGDPIAPPRPTEIDEPSSMEFRRSPRPSRRGRLRRIQCPFEYQEPVPRSFLLYPERDSPCCERQPLLHTQRSRTDDY